ncbi:MAG: amidohydrolase family protein [Acidobacteria bacterium]|nr:amidohydrolase family protein [Acidobacteriota bacterium]
MHPLWVSLALLAPWAQAQPVDTLWTARYVVTMDSQRRLIEQGAIAVKDGAIVAAGPATELRGRYTPKQRLDRPDAILIPGLINAHTHAAMSLLRGVADDLALQEWLEKFIFPAEARNLNAEFVRWGTRLAALEMMLGGVTTFADMYYFEDAVAEETKAAGMRGVLGQTVIQFPVADHKTPESALAATERFMARFANDPLIVPAVAPHAVYTNSDATLRKARQLANRFKMPLLIHLSETRRENDDLKAKRGMTPTHLLDLLGVLEGRTLGAHGVWLDDADIAILKQRGTGLAHCPSSNMKLASGAAPLAKILGAGIAMGLGTDGPAGSNNDFNLFEEMDLAAKLQKVTRNDPRALPAEEALAMATIHGARALGLENRIGSLEAGKRADIAAVSLRGAHAAPLFNVYSQLVYALKASDVTDVMVEGRLIVRSGASLALDAAAIQRKAAEYGNTVRNSLR